MPQPWKSAKRSVAIGDFGPSPRTGKSCYPQFDAAGKSATIYGYYEGAVVDGLYSFDMPTSGTSGPYTFALQEWIIVNNY